MCRRNEVELFVNNNVYVSNEEKKGDFFIMEQYLKTSYSYLFIF